jgi:hypothetical protein
MMPEEWPIAACAADQNAPARPAGSGRLPTVRADFFLDPAKRLSEQERALMTAMLHCLVGDIADELRAELPKGWAAANDGENLKLIDALSAARLLDEPGLMALLLRRADEERIGSAARARIGRREGRTLQGLVSHDNGAVSAAAMALILARGRRRDRFGQCLIAFEDLSSVTAQILVNAIAAAMRGNLASSHAPGAADSELSKAAADLLGRVDRERSIDALSAALVRLLDENGSLSDELVVAAALEGEVGFVAQALARRGGIAGLAAFEELLCGEAPRLMALLRIARLSRDSTAGLLAGIGDLLGIDDPGEAIGVYDRMSDEQVAAARTWLVAEPAYRAALEAMGVNDGQRTV